MTRARRGYSHRERNAPAHLASLPNRTPQRRLPRAMAELSVSTVIRPDAVEPIVGFRQWVVIADQIISPLARTPWAEEAMEAECLGRCRHAGGLWRRATEHDGPAPDPDCVCGIYALFVPDPPRRRQRMSRVEGAVVVWGRLEIHETGLRAEFARIVALALPGGRHRSADRLVARLARRIGVDAVPREHLEAVGLLHGQRVPPVLLPG